MKKKRENEQNTTESAELNSDAQQMDTHAEIASPSGPLPESPAEPQQSDLQSSPDAAKSKQTDSGDTPDNGQTSQTPESQSPTPEQTAAAVALVESKLEPVNAKIRDLKVARVGEDGAVEPVTSVFQVLPIEAIQEPRLEKFPCRICGEAFKDSAGLKRHTTRKHGEDAAATAEPTAAALAEPDGVRPERRAEPAAIISPAGTKQNPGVQMDAVALFDNFLAEILPPPLTEQERALLAMVDIKVEIPEWIFKYAVLGLILGPRVIDKIRALKRQFDADVAKQREIDAQAKREREMREAIARRQQVVQTEPVAAAPVAAAVEPAPAVW